MTENERIDGFIEILRKIKDNDPWMNNNNFLTHGQVIRLSQGLISVFPRHEFQTHIANQIEIWLEAMSCRGILHTNRSEFAKQIINLLLAQKEYNEFIIEQHAKDSAVGITVLNSHPLFF